MRIQKVDPARTCFDDYSLDGTVLNIGGVAVNLAEEEGDQEVVITLGKCNGMVHRGLKPTCVYVAEVIIPPRKYITEEVDGPPEGMMLGGEEEIPETHTETMPVPLDVGTVTLKVWPVIEEENNGN